MCMCMCVCVCVCVCARVRETVTERNREGAMNRMTDFTTLELIEGTALSECRCASMGMHVQSM